MTLRSNENTTIYGYSDRLRGIEGTRDVLLINLQEMQKAALEEGQIILLVRCRRWRGTPRKRPEALPFALPNGCLAGYYPELNPLIPPSHHDKLSRTPAAKNVPVRIEA